MIQPPRKIPYDIQPKVKEALDGLKAQNTIGDVDRPTDWVSNLVIVDNKSGALRLCVGSATTERSHQARTARHTNARGRSNTTVWHESIHSGRHEGWLLVSEAKRRIVVLLHVQYAMGQETLPSNALRNLLRKRDNAEMKRGNIWRYSRSPRHC